MAKCGMKTEIWTRVCGYHARVTAMNKGQQAQYHKRLTYQLSKEFKDLKKGEKVS